MFESHISIIVELCISLILCLLILLYFSRKKMNIIIFITSLLCWFMNLFLIILIPYDVYYSQKNDKQIPKPSENLIDYGFQLTYWILFILSWFIIPILQEYEISGEFKVSEKLKASLKSNIKFFVTLGIIGLIAIFYCMFAMGFNFTFLLVKNFSLIYGFLLFFFLLSYGLIRYPKRLYLKFKFERHIKYLEWKANNLVEKLKKLTEALINNYSKLKATIDKYKDDSKENNIIEEKKEEDNQKDEKIKENDDSDDDSSSGKEKTVEDYITEINKKFEDFIQNSLEYGINSKVEFYDKNGPIKSYTKLIEVNKKIKLIQNDSLRLQSKLRNCYMRWAKIKSILFYTQNKNKIVDNNDYNKIDDAINESNKNNSKDSDKIKVKNKKDEEEKNEKSLEDEGFIPLDDLNDNKIICFYFFKKYFYIVLLIISILAGVFIILLELYIVCGFRFILIYKNIENIIIIHFSVLIPLIYLISMSNYTLFKVKLFSYLFMYGPRQTDSISLITFSSYLSRVYFAICINYMMIVNQFSERQYSSKFEAFFDLNKNYVVLNICRYLPILLFIFIVLFYFNIPGKIGHCFGRNLFEFDTRDRNIGIDNGHKYLMSLNKELAGKKLEYNDIRMFEYMD